MTSIAELGSFLAREQPAASPPLATAGPLLPSAAAGRPISPHAATANGTAMS